MRPPVTFFRNKDSAGETCEFKVETQEETYYFCVYSLSPLDSKFRQDKVLRDGESFRDVWSDVHQNVVAKGGGVLVLLSGQECGRLDKVVSTYPSAEMQIEKFGVLKPGYPLFFEPVGKKNWGLPQGSQVIVPVDSEAQQNFLDFYKHLSGFPRDLESLVLYTLRRPALDSRVEKLEARVFGRTATTDQGRLWARLRRWLGSPDSHWPLTALVLTVLLAGNAFMLYRLTGRLDTLSPGTPPVTGSPPVSGTPSTVSPQTSASVGHQEPPLAEVTRELFTALSARTDALHDLAPLYKNHFSRYGDQLLNEQVVHLFDRGNNNAFLLGLIKLEALRLEPGIPNKEIFLGDRDDNINATKSVFRNMDHKVLDKDATGRDLLAFLSCRLSYGGTPSPDLPDTTAKGGSPAFPFAPGKSCDTFGPEKAQQGLKDLADFVEKHP